MPFGRVFAAVFFCVVGVLSLVTIEMGRSILARGAAFAWTAFAVLLAVSLLSRAAWPRWVGALGAVAVGVLSALQIPLRGGMLDFLLVLGACLALLLLLIPATGRRVPVQNEETGVFTSMGWITATLGTIALVLAGWNVQNASVRAPQAVTAANLEVIQAEKTQRMAWDDFGAGLERARAEGKPLLVHFTATWCGYCKKMDRSTWMSPSVIERTASDVIAVRVDVDQTETVNGFSGSGLAGRYRVNGTPSQMLLDTDGTVLSRAGGFQDSRQLLSWLEQGLTRADVQKGASRRIQGTQISAP